MELGHYRHFKGGHYSVVGLARHSETLEDMVIYRPIDREGDVWVRPLAMFEESVQHQGATVPRFTYLGPA
jgi:hypothetical protein